MWQPATVHLGTRNGIAVIFIEQHYSKVAAKPVPKIAWFMDPKSKFTVKSRQTCHRVFNKTNKRRSSFKVFFSMAVVALSDAVVTHFSQIIPGSGKRKIQGKRSYASEHHLKARKKIKKILRTIPLLKIFPDVGYFIGLGPNR